MSDFVIEDGRLQAYQGEGGDVAIPEGVRYLSILAFEHVSLTSLTLPASMWDLPQFLSRQEQLTDFWVSEENPRFKSVEGVLYDKDGSVLLLCPEGRVGELRVQHGATEVKYNAMLGCRITSLYLPATVTKTPEYTPASLQEILVDPENPVLKSVDGVLYDRNTNTLLAYPAGRTGEYFVPEGTTCVLLDSFAANRGAKYQLHISAGVSVKMQWAEMVDGNGHITVYAPIGSEAERMARRCDCQFVPEGETVALDDSNERKERSFQQWRLIFSFSSRSKGAHISKFVRGSKVVYLPDKIGKADVASLEKNAFLPDTAVLCSKRLFAKLAEANKLATVRAYLENGDLFLPDEGKYLKEFIKKNPVQVFEMLIGAEAMAAMESCLKEVKFAAAVMDAAMEVADRLGRIDIKAFLLDCQNRAASAK